MVVALIALMVALAGPGYAALHSILFAKRAGNADRVDGLRASRRPRPNTLLALNSKGKFPASVGAIGPRGPQGDPGKNGNAGAPGSALAYTTIVNEPPDSGGAPVWRIDDVLSKRLDNDVNFSHPTQGVFCFHDLPFAVANVIATPGPFGSNKPFLVQAAAARPGQTIGAPCPLNTTVAVYTTDTNSTSTTLHDPPDDSDTISVEMN
jgi:hypothetical protein